MSSRKSGCIGGLVDYGGGRVVYGSGVAAGWCMVAAGGGGCLGGTMVLHHRPVRYGHLSLVPAPTTSGGHTVNTRGQYPVPINRMEQYCGG